MANLFYLSTFKINELTEKKAFSKSANSKTFNSLQSSGVYFIPLILADRSILNWWSIDNF
jgi:hypothetical protein